MPSFFIQQFGCRATQADGAALERQLLDRGCTSAPTSATADIIVVNTCTVTASADAQARDAIRKFHATNPAVRVIVTGCYAQRAPEELAALPGVSWVVGNSHKPQIPQLVDSLPAAAPAESASGFFPAARLHSGSAVPFHSFVGAPHLSRPRRDAAPQLAKILTGNIFDRTEFLSAPVLGGEGNHTRPTLKIQDGCNSRCSYCVIPFVRGRSRSLPPDAVIREILHLSETGYREIVLSGINLGTYGRDLSPRVEFEDLLRRILEETSVERLRISSIEPLDVTEDLVSFPGESEDDHAATLAFIESLPFTYLHVFSFSKRPGTKAATLASEVPGVTIKRRARELRALGESKAAAFRQSQLGRTLRVLTLRPGDDTDLHSTALSTNYLRVQIPGPRAPNNWVDVQITGKMRNGLTGEVWD